MATSAPIMYTAAQRSGLATVRRMANAELTIGAADPLSVVAYQGQSHMAIGSGIADAQVDDWSCMLWSADAEGLPLSRGTAVSISIGSVVMDNLQIRSATPIDSTGNTVLLLEEAPA